MAKRNPHQEAPQPQPRRDQFGVPWCQRNCSALFLDGKMFAVKKCGLTAFPVVPTTTICFPQARADAAELALMKEEVADLLATVSNQEREAAAARAELAPQLGLEPLDYAFVKRRLWRPRLCNRCWRLLWLRKAFERLRPQYHAVQIVCLLCGKDFI